MNNNKEVFYNSEMKKDIDRQPLTLEDLRQRLKHIAGLCWGLSIDINNEIERNVALNQENVRLLNQIARLREEIKILKNPSGGSSRKKLIETKLATMTPQEREAYEKKRAQRHKEYLRNLEKKRAAQGGNND